MSLSCETYSPEILNFMRTILEDATALLPEADQTSVTKADMAAQILEQAVGGEHDPIALRTSALSEAAKHLSHCHYISATRRAV
jgi:hypothetical protein